MAGDLIVRCRSIPFYVPDLATRSAGCMSLALDMPSPLRYDPTTRAQRREARRGFAQD